MKSNRTDIRPPAAAGRFYPGDPAELRRVVEELLHSAAKSEATPPPALIAPHAGYVYSGPIAASAYMRWKGAAETIRRVALIGPAHFVEFDGLASSSASAFETPLGLVPVDTQAVQDLISRGLVTISDAAHFREHSLEVQLPFLQVLIKEFSIVPLVVGHAEDSEVAAVIEALWSDPHTGIVISSDLSHYLDWSSAKQIDQLTAEAVCGLRPAGIGHHQACGCVPVRGLLLAARKRGLKAEMLDLRNSGDTAGTRDQVVGYGAFAFN